MTSHWKVSILALLTTVVVGRATPSKIRGLAVGDFAELNQLLDGVVVALPDIRASTSLISLRLTNLRCTDLRVGDVTLTSTKSSRGTTTVQLDIIGLDMVCYTDYRYTFIFTRRGSADLFSTGNAASVTMALDSPSVTVPTVARVQECIPAVNIANMNFRGSISAIVFDALEGLVRERVERAANERICQELRTLTSTLIADWLGLADETLAEYPPNQIYDPLLPEKELIVPSGVRILDLQDTSSAVAKWVDRMLFDVTAFATKKVDGGLGREEINLNVLVRENLLDADRSYVLDANRYELFYNHDKFLEISCLLETVKIFGLDTLTSFEPLDRIGAHTVQNAVSWSRLSIEADVLIEIKPSTLPDSIFVRASRGIQERVKVKFGIENVKAVASILLAVDELDLGRLSLSSLLVADNIIDCFFSTFYRAGLSGLSLEAVDILPPTVDGFVSRGLDRVISESVDTAFLMYESAILTAAPGFFETTFKEFVNTKFLDSDSDSSFINRACPTESIESSQDGFVDFRDLLLPPLEAENAGGTGLQPYGNLVYMAVSEFKGRLLEKDEDGSPRVNSVVRSQLSNDTEPTLFVGDVVNWNSSITMAGLRAVAWVKLLDVRVYNLDSFGPPLQILEPVVWEPHLLNNTAVLGVGPESVRFEADLLLAVSDEADLQLENKVAVALEFTAANVALLLRLKLLETPFFSVPLEDTLNPNCWLSTMLPGTDLTHDIILAFDLLMDELQLNVSCVACSSPLFDDLIYELYSPEETGNSTGTLANVLGALQETNILNVTSDQIVQGASKQCPHNANYDPGFSYRAFFAESGGGSAFSKSARDRKAVYFNIANAIVAACLILMFVICKIVTRRRHRGWMASMPSEAIDRLRRRESLENDRINNLNATTDSLYQSQELPRHVRFFVPVFLFLTLFIQLAGHVAVLSTVDLVGQIAGEPYAIEEFLSFSFFKAAARTYNNGGSEMSILLFLFTGIWPYIKLLACVTLWFVPPRIVSVSRRETILLWLDIFAKLSMVDIFTMLIGVAVLLVFIGGSNSSEFGKYFSSIIIVNPHGGFYCILIAQRMTRISARYLLDCHNQIIASADRNMQRSHSLKMMSTEIFGCVDDSLSVNDDLNVGSRSQAHPKPSVQAMQSLKTTSTRSWDDDDELSKPRELIDDSHDDTAAYECDNRHLSPTNTVDSKTEGKQPCRAGSFLFRHWKRLYRAIDKSMIPRRYRVPGFKPTTPTKSTNSDRFSYWRRIAGGFTIVSILIIGIIGAAMAPSISIDAKSVWGMFESGKTYSEVVSDYPFFRVKYNVLVQSRFVLDSMEEKIGFGLLLVAAAIAVAGYPAMKAISSFYRWKQRQPRPFNLATVVKKTCSSLMKVPSTICSCAMCLGNGPATYTTFDSDLDLLPAYRIKAWRHLEVYVIAFIIACWQLGAATSYVIHMYCFVLEAIFSVLGYLGLVESTSAQCFREQASAPSSILILFTAFLVLLVSFLVEARGQYNRVMAKASDSMKETTNASDLGLRSVSTIQN